MLKTMRSSTKTIMWIVAAAFVGLIFLQWGMDIGDQKNADEIVVGSVNGQEISWRQYQSALSTNRKLMMNRLGQLPDDETEEMLNEQTWESLVGEILLAQEAKRLDITVTDADVLNEIERNPPPEIRSLEIFQTDGSFDPEKYGKALADPRVDWSWLERYVRSYLPQQKMQQRVWATVVVTDREAEQEYRRRNEEVSLEYVVLGPEDFANQEFRLTDEEIDDYYEAHRSEYRRPASVRAELVSVPLVPSEADDRRARNLLAEVEEDLADDVAFEDLAEDYSDDASASRGGNIGWFRRGDLREKVLDNAIFSLTDVGDVSEPVRGERGYYLFKLADRREDAVLVNQILIEVKPGRQSMARLSAKTEELRREALEGNLAQAAEEAGLEVTTTDSFTEDSPPSELSEYPQAVKFCFENATGDVSPVIETDRAFLVVRIVESIPEQEIPLNEIRAQVREALQRDKRREIAGEAAEDLAREAAAGGGVERPAQKRRFTVHEEESFSRVGPPPDLRPLKDVLAMAFALPEGQVSPVVADGGRFYILQVKERTSPDEDQFVEERDSLRGELLYRKRQEAFAAWFQELREKADITDNREELFAGAQAEEAYSEESDEDDSGGELDQGGESESPEGQGTT